MPKINELKLIWDEANLEASVPLTKNTFYNVERGYPHLSADLMDEVDKLENSELDSDTLKKIVCNAHYMHFLQIADKEGLLTKEASQSLKPDNYIHWRYIKSSLLGLGVRTPKTTGNTLKGIYFRIYDEGSTFDVWAIDNGESIELEYQESEQNAKDYCQNWLNNYLKENNE